MKIQGVVRDKQGCDYYRIVLPLMYLNKDTEWTKNNSAEILFIAIQEHLIDCDILMYNKFIATPVQVLKEEQAKGMKIIVDVDDMWILPSWHSGYKQWAETGSDKLTEEHIRNADLVTCTSLKLQDELRKLNKNTVVIPNAVPFGEGLFQPGPVQDHQKMNFIYAGGVTHLPDLELIRGKFERIGTDNYIRDNAEFIMAGYEQAKRRMYATKADLDAGNNNYTLENIHGPYDAMKNIFAATGSYSIIPTEHVTKYIQCYDNADVVLVPMVDTHWNKFKSVLKLIEAATRHIPVICSAVEPYTELRPCEGVMWVDKPDQWIEYIRWCIKHKDETKQMGEQLYNWVSKEYDLHTWNLTRQQLFSTLIN